MYIKTISWADWDGNERTEDFYFNLTKTELIKLQLRYPGGLVETADKLSKSEDKSKILDILDSLVMAAYGEKSADGRKFEKKDGQLAKEFASTGAYDALFMEMATVDGAMAEFIRNILPKDIQKATEAQVPLSVVKNN